MANKLFSKFNCKFSGMDDLVASLDNKEMKELLASHGVNMANEINKLSLPLNSNGSLFPTLRQSPLVPSDDAIETAMSVYHRDGVLSYCPEYVFADDNGIGFMVRYRKNNDLDYYAMAVRKYDTEDYSRVFSNQHNMPEVAVKEYANSIDFNNILKLPFYKNHALTYHALCLSTKYTGDVYIQEISQSDMNSEEKKSAILDKLITPAKLHGYYIVALYSNGGSIVHCEDKGGNPFDSFVLNVEYYNVSKSKIHEEHYVFAYGQEYIPFTDEDGNIYRDEHGNVYYDIKHTPKAKGKLSNFEKGEPESLFSQYFASEFGTRYPLLGDGINM